MHTHTMHSIARGDFDEGAGEQHTHPQVAILFPKYRVYRYIGRCIRERIADSSRIAETFFVLGSENAKLREFARCRVYRGDVCLLYIYVGSAVLLAFHIN